jgi:hypothetical protein
MNETAAGTGPCWRVAGWSALVGTGGRRTPGAQGRLTGWLRTINGDWLGVVDSRCPMQTADAGTVM